MGCCVFSVAGAMDWWTDVATIDIHYQAIEHAANGSIADQEKGPLSGAEARLGLRAGKFLCDADALTASGSLSYAGMSDIGFPIATTTSLHFNDTSVGCGRRFVPANADGFDVGVRIGERRIDRAIEASFLSSGLGELLKAPYMRFGANYEHRFPHGIRAYVEGELEHGFSETLNIDFESYADNTTLHPGGRFGGDALLGTRWYPARWASLGIEYEFDRETYGASDPQTLNRAATSIGTVRYPGSVQRWTTARILIGVFF